MIDKIKIGALDYSVGLVPDLKPLEHEPMCYGFISHINQHIDIEEKMTPPVQKIALLHEVLHGVLHQSGTLSSDEENLVIAISHGLYALLRDNPDFIKYITSDK